MPPIKPWPGGTLVKTRVKPPIAMAHIDGDTARKSDCAVSDLIIGEHGRGEGQQQVSVWLFPKLSSRRGPEGFHILTRATAGPDP